MNEKLNQAVEQTKQFLVNDLWKQIKENWRLILVAAIVVAISLNSFWSDKSANQKSEGALASPSSQNQDIAQNDQNQNNGGDNVSPTPTVTPTPTPSASPEPQASNAPSDNTPSGDVISETAQKGEGVTHLARRAIKEYTESTGTKLSAEQKIYAEDYLKHQVGSNHLEVGQTLKFDKNMIKTGVDKAGSLSESQIHNLSKFVPLVKNL